MNRIRITKRILDHCSNSFAIIKIVWLNPGVLQTSKPTRPLSHWVDRFEAIRGEQRRVETAIFELETDVEALFPLSQEGRRMYDLLKLECKAIRMMSRWFDIDIALIDRLLKTPLDERYLGLGFP